MLTGTHKAAARDLARTIVLEGVAALCDEDRITEIEFIDALNAELRNLKNKLSQADALSTSGLPTREALALVDTTFGPTPGELQEARGETDAPKASPIDSIEAANELDPAYAATLGTRTEPTDPLLAETGFTTPAPLQEAAPADEPTTVAAPKPTPKK